MIVQEEIPYTQAEINAMVQTIEQLRKENQELLEKQKPAKDKPTYLSPDRAGDSIRLSDLPKMKTQWKRIPKDKDGLYDEEASTMYDELPIIIIQEYKDNGLSGYSLYYVDQDDWHDWQADLNKPTFNWYMPCEKLPIEL